MKTKKMLGASIAAVAALAFAALPMTASANHHNANMAVHADHGCNGKMHCKGKMKCHSKMKCNAKMHCHSKMCHSKMKCHSMHQCDCKMKCHAKKHCKTHR